MIEARRVKSFLSSLEQAEALAHLSLASSGTGSSAVMFTPDSQRLVMALTGLSVVVVALPRTEEDEVRVMDSFAPLESHNGRVIVSGKKQRKRERERAKKRAELANAGIAHGDDDVEMSEPASHRVDGQAEDDDQVESDEVNEGSKREATPGAWRVCLAASDDGQWLATSDLLGRVGIYNLDTSRVSSEVY